MAANNANAKESTAKAGNQNVISKKLLVDEYKKRLKDNVKSLNDNFSKMLNAAKIINEEEAHKNNEGGRMADHETIYTEMCSRASLMVKSTDELLMLTNDIREFLILRDFNFLSQSISSAEKQAQSDIDAIQNEYNRMRFQLSQDIAELDKELMENFGLRK